jgi:hypothetical protein
MNRVAEPIKPAYLDSEELASRWRCHVATARRRMKKFGIRPLRLSKRSVLYRMTDVERLEGDCT